MTRITSHVLAVGLLATALVGCGKSWPHPKAGAHAPTTPYQATQSATPRPAGETLPFTFHSEIQLGEVFASELQWVGPGYVYAHLRKLPDGSKSAGTIVFDPTRRVMLWKHEGQENEMSEWVGSTQTHLVVRRQLRGENSTDLVTHNLQTGSILSQKAIGPKDEVLSVQADSNTVILWDHPSRSIRAYNLTNYRSRWTLALGGQSAPVVFTHGQELVAIGSHGAILFNPANGHTAWKTAPAHLQVPVVAEHDGKSLAWVTADDRMQRVSLASGKITHTSQRLQPEPTWTDLQRVGSRWLLRGEWTTAQYLPLQAIVSLDDSLHESWRAKSIITTTSNIVSNENTLFLADAHTSVALDTNDGKILWMRRISDSGEGYPMLVRLTNTGVVFEGELVVTSLNPQTGIPLWRRGINPIGMNLDMQSLKDSEDTLRKILKVKANDHMAASRNLHFQAMTMQRQSNLLMAQANKARFEGKGYKAFKLRNQARTSSSLSSAFNLGSLAMSGISMALQMQEASFREGRMKDLGFRVMAQHSIARHAENVYSGEYTYRPSTTSESAGIKLINFETGAHKTIPTGHDMRGIGLLNLVDCQRGIFVHFGNSRAKARPSNELFVIDTHLQVGRLSCDI